MILYNDHNILILYNIEWWELKVNWIISYWGDYYNEVSGTIDVSVVDTSEDYCVLLGDFCKQKLIKKSRDSGCFESASLS